jgi:hypothetical protein
VRRIVRTSMGFLVALALAYVLPLGSTGYAISLNMLLIGLVGGFVMGSRWSIPLIPVTILAGGWLHQRIKCPDCPSGTDMTLGAQFILLAIMLGLAALSAWAGATGARLVSRV